jgi:two-component system sensor histidine kinase CiaH
MATDSRKLKLRRTTIVYWSLLVYILAALLWWLISLEKQNQRIRAEQLQLLELQAPQLEPIEKEKRVAAIESLTSRNSTKYVSEGITFLIVILIGAVGVYRAVRRQLRAQQQQQQFMMAVTHELKTPIAVTRLNLETMQRYKLEPEKQEKLIRIALDETSRLNFLTNNILVSSQLENKGFAGEKEELDFSLLVTDCIKDMGNRFPGRIIESAIEPEIDLQGDALLLQILLNNLLENAIKYSPAQSTITVQLKKAGSQVLLKVSDQGEGVPDTEKKKIFERFYRVGNEATRTTKGTGLGLYLCERIARHHQATMSVSDNSPKGSVFHVNFVV